MSVVIILSGTMQALFSAMAQYLVSSYFPTKLIANVDF